MHQRAQGELLAISREFHLQAGEELLCSRVRPLQLSNMRCCRGNSALPADMVGATTLNAWQNQACMLLATAGLHRSRDQGKQPSTTGLHRSVLLPRDIALIEAKISSISREGAT